MKASNGIVIGLGGALVLLIIGCGALAIILPAIQKAREASRRTQCSDHMLHQCLALQNYHDTFLYLPYGARNRTVPPEYDEASWGPSWMVSCIPFYGINRGYDAMIKADFDHRANDYISAIERQRGTEFPVTLWFMSCPSSPLPEWQVLSGSRLVLPSYAGIMGGNDEIPNGSTPLQDRPGVYIPTPQTVQDATGRIVKGPYGGFAAGNGMLVINECLTMAACTDGTANVLIVGEVSDWYYDDSGAPRNPAMSVSDAGDGVKSDAAGWLAGNNLDLIAKRKGMDEKDWPGKDGGRYPHFVFKNGPAIPLDRVCNLITLHQPIGTNNYRGTRDAHPNWGTQGIGRCGLNNPLLSAHPQGAMVVYLDGHVQLMSKETSTWILKRLANRDDGGMIPDF